MRMIIILIDNINHSIYITIINCNIVWPKVKKLASIGFIALGLNFKKILLNKLIFNDTKFSQDFYMRMRIILIDIIFILL